jgi:hypothetical protein
VRALAIAVVALIAVQILANGYLPQDDALRHAAKAVSGRNWDQILLLHPGVVDFSPGWHALLAALHRITGANAHTLVLIEVISLFVIFSLGPLLLLRRPEAWIVAMAMGAVLEPQLVLRLIIGRPLVLSMGILVVMCLTWRNLDTEQLSRRAFAIAVALVAAATWIHGSWYLWALPAAACFLARRYRLGVRFLAATVLGISVAALLTGHPIAFVWQTLELALSVSGGISQWVYEMQPYPFFTMLILAAALLVIARKVWLGVPARTLLTDPVFALAALGWLLGFKAARFWMDWGMPALLAFLALEIQALWLAHAEQRRRLLVAGALSVICFVVWTANVGQRWNTALEPAFRAMLAPERASAMPDSGGILYADDRRMFYQMFFLKPTAPWRYVLGFGPELMPAQDYAVYFQRQTTTSIESLEPWARKLRPEDRLIIRDPRGIPLWPWLEWQQIEGGFYSGRLKRSSRIP